MITEQMKLEKSTLKRLTTERREHGETAPDTEKILTTLGVFWDEIEQEYFDESAFLIEFNTRILRPLEN